MYWEEKIDLLKQQYAPSEFSVPFTQWVAISKEIERKFIIRAHSGPFRNWAENIRGKTKLGGIGRGELVDYLSKLPSTANYWMVVVQGNDINGKYYLYDCGIKPLTTLASLCNGDFYIVDKKYAWLVYFSLEKETGKINVYSGSDSPFQ
ncbi:DUF6756 family protein [Chitinophaga barathri]|uniref:Uncharacterized protein n=1 Tax=Chitinophaga barathri TaxID=1647451 RepID=A0A3N4MG56_9BACT|nr:DUF6756 family protein [Chitinophaga barathri]RPD42578.1 hypothetical protein EG028_05235 [Chitinophaga barathri]